MKRSLYRRLRKLSSLGIETMDVAGNLNPKHTPGQEITYYHSGDFGDIIYALPTLRALGAGHLILGPTQRYKTRQVLTAELAELIIPLLRLQPYVRSVKFGKPVNITYDLNQFRDYLLAEPELLAKGAPRRNLAEAHLLSFRLPLEECYRPWLTVDHPVVDPERPVIMHRSSRWRNPRFPWAKVMEMHGSHAAFVGLPSEYSEFVNTWGSLPYIPTPDLLQLARIIAGCKLYVGNQSLPYALAAALHKDSLLEVWPEGPNCQFPRKNAFYGEGTTTYIPELCMSPESESLQNCPLCGTAAAEAPVYRETTDIVKCSECGLVYLRTLPHPALVHAYYQTYADAPTSHMRLPTTISEIKTSGLRRENFLEALVAHHPQRGDLLDIGGGWGAFAANARDKGFTSSNCEIACKQANFCSTILGIPTYTEDVYTATLEPESLEVVSCIHTLEHLRETRTVLAAVYSLLRPGGLFCGIVPNIESLCSQKMKERWPWLDAAEHFVHFSTSTLRACLETRGFQVLKISTTTGDFSVDLLQRCVTELLDKALSQTEFNAYLQQIGAEGKGEEIWFFAQKPTRTDAL